MATAQAAGPPPVSTEMFECLAFILEVNVSRADKEIFLPTWMTTLHSELAMLPGAPVVLVETRRRESILQPA